MFVCFIHHVTINNNIILNSKLLLVFVNTCGVQLLLSVFFLVVFTHTHTQDVSSV
jgi:hypothetical protein